MMYLSKIINLFRIKFAQSLNYLYYLSSINVFRYLANIIIYGASLEMEGIKFYLSSPSDVAEVRPEYEKTVFIYMLKVIHILCGNSNSICMFIDVGAHIGVHALRIARSCPNCLVLAIEPNPSCYRMLTRAIKSSRINNVHAINAGLSDMDGYGTLCIKPITATSSFVELSNCYNTMQVPVLQLDTLMRFITQFIPYDRLKVVIKIDVEGAELKVLRGAALTLRALMPILFIEVRERNLKDFKRFMDDMDYKCQRIYEENWMCVAKG